jgi:tRNA(fMet)-specific endonuclease VapC
MSLWILDTDHVSLFLEGNRQVGKRAAEKFPNVAVTIITVQEVYNGWMGQLNNPIHANQQVWLYTKLWEATEFFRLVPVLNFTQSAQDHYQELLLSNKTLAKKRLEKDIKISAIVLANNGIAVTRNHKDFSLVPNLQIENWAE